MELESPPTWQLVVALLLRRDDARMLLHRRPPGKRHAGLWEFPGGKMEPGENPCAALVREATEELGIELREGDLSPAGFAHEHPGLRERPIVILLYSCALWGGEPRSLEGGAVGWFGVEELAGLAMPPLDMALRAPLLR